MREGNEQDAESACKSLRWDGRSGYANVGKRCWVGASGAHQSVVHKWCRPRIPHPSSRCVYIKCIIFCSYTYIIYAYFNLRMRRKSVVGCRSSHHRELPSVRPPVMTGAGSSSQMPSRLQVRSMFQFDNRKLRPELYFILTVRFSVEQGVGSSELDPPPHRSDQQNTNCLPKPLLRSSRRRKPPLVR